MAEVVRTTKRFKVIRKSVSEYQGNNFKQFEKDHLEIIPEIDYIWSEDGSNEQGPLILITNSQTDIKQFSDEELAKTELLIHPNSGHDNLTKEFVEKVNFPIILGNPIRSHAVVNYIMSALFKHFVHFEHQKEWDPNREWNRPLLKEKNVLLIGYGHIGKLVHQSLGPLVKNIHIYDPDKGHSELKLEDRNIVIVAASLNPTSHGIIDKKFLNSLPTDFVLINPARGKIVNQLELMEVFSKNKRATAYLDVFETEPYSSLDFLGLNNIMTTSHIAGVYSGLNSEIVKYEFDVINKFIEHCDDLDAFKEHFSDLLLQNKLRDNYFL